MHVLSENRNTQKRSSKDVIKEQHNAVPHALLQARRRHLAGSTRQPSTRPSANEVQVLGRNIRSLSLVAIWVWRSKAHIHLIHSVLSLFSLILFYIFLSVNSFVFLCYLSISWEVQYCQNLLRCWEDHIWSNSSIVHLCSLNLTESV